MTLLRLSDVAKAWGSHVVLDGAELQIDPGEKLGLVGPNGAGKSTLLALIEGRLEVDRGTLSLRRGARLCSVAQRPEFPEGATVREHVEGGLAELRAAMTAHAAASEELAALAARAADVAADTDEAGQHERSQRRLLSEQDRHAQRIEALGGWHTLHRVEQVLDGIGLPRATWGRPCEQLSGGERSRVALARALVGGHELLLLDEPTNHLDIEGIEWLESWIRSLPCAVLLVSHDRRLLDNVVDGIVELEHGRLSRFPGGATRYLALREERFTAQRRAWQEQQEYIRREEAFIARYMAGQRSAEARGRRTRLARLVRLPEPRQDVRAPVLSLRPAARGGELVLTAEELACGWDGVALFRGVSLRVSKGERVGLTGPNGAGKSTLLSVLAGRAAPLAGKLRHGAHDACGYFDQHAADLLEDGTPFSELRRADPQAGDQELREVLARFLFRGEEIHRPVAALSGGERARLALAVLLAGKPDWLALDEPTNHLDFAAHTALVEALDGFGGAILFVSHDRQLLDDLATRLLVVEPGRVTDFPGTWSAWRAQREQREAESGPATTRARASAAAGDTGPSLAPGSAEASRSAPPPAAGAAVPADVTAAAAAAAAPRPRNPWLLARLEAAIEKLEREQAELHARCALPDVAADGEAMRAIAQRLAELATELDAAWAEWGSRV